ncbi:MAG: hypothetical protein ABI277_15315 [Burkholderiaceae bacterium]
MRPDDEVEALREAHRIASDRIDERPDAAVRAAVLAAAARGVEARPRLATTQTSKPSASGPFRAGRWPLSAAALLVVSVLTGVIATRVLRDSPERLTTVASSVPPPQIEKAADSESKTAPASPAATTGPARTGRPKITVDDSHRREAPRAVQRPAPAPFPSPASSMAAPARAHEARPDFRAKAEAAASSNDSADALAAETTALPAGTGAVRAAPAPSTTRSRIGRAAEPATPEAWIERIVKLRADGNDVEADRELEALRRRYPGFEIATGALKTSGTR